MSTKPAHVREMFGSIATRYDLANHIDAAWNYKRAASEPRKLCYPG